ncbi:PEP-CTERM sorting domain-containing protein [Bythopirellula goksoeyrii]|uniref:PEP-CTERM motif protein n=1 Tax=Bythopirellula goksoeyrii TaxID=1400387 RepID=A0A5B9QIK4_9BACT|nr:PEP-CTERM sorting domain-containing protein [Bythopirellula goksoeyrii]QEG37355.1 PEP-CTERM motif protein [Bythopirellula goksoeyrii]
MKNRFVPILSAMLVAAASSSAWAALFTQNFDVDDTANWTVNNGPSDEAHDIFFDYSTVGIPSAPNSAGTTRGMKLQANLTDGIFSGMSVSPNGQSFSGDYVVEFDAWANFNGPFPGGGSGSTNLATFGIGTTGTTAQWAGGVQDSVWFAATGDGGSSADWRAYSTAASTSYAEGDPIYAAASRNAPDPYYAGFGNLASPAAQLGLFPQQTGNTQVGTFGMAWHEVSIKKLGTTATWSVDGTLIATIDLTTVTLGGDNIFFGHSDINATSSSDANDAALLFTLIDNVNVDAIPEPASFALLGLSLFGLVAAGRKRS